MTRPDVTAPPSLLGESIWPYAFLAFQPLFLGAVVLGYRVGFIAEQVAFWGTWILLFPLVRRIGARPRAASRSRLSVAVEQVITAGAIVLLHLVVSLGIEVALLALTPHGVDREILLLTHPALIVLSVAVYAFLASFVAAGQNRGRIAEQQRIAGALRERLAESRFQALRAQLNPHFVFNGLNTASMLIRSGDNQGAIRFISGIGELMREALDDSRPQEVPLDEELEFIRKYLAVERVRFADRLETTIDATAEARVAFVPALVLQPIVENAVRHGIARRPGSGRIDVQARRDGSFLEVSVRDDGAGLIADTLVSGMGLRLTESRLRELYGGDAALSVQSETDRPGVMVRMRIPYCTTAIR